eukprot:CAMPEP_0202488250 /NCGR_PEP_ID=MMETSP1361-20130828/6341_1 /ASSEMBLY_ACC=CAM_ASM_000849 /TAXON_ID=210615 /ORGANISM="Staurosira complex sp., Strain CCMP2646" /LENGTH=56 /DNA_ID=CAMNT_0049117785 /DNA_START=214 /DNA_END=380 /DNA_ORIENTATION=-
MSGEEQGRDTLHGHFQIWVQQYNDMRHQLYEGRRQERRQAQQELSNLLDETASAKL